MNMKQKVIVKLTTLAKKWCN